MAYPPETVIKPCLLSTVLAAMYGSGPTHSGFLERNVNDSARVRERERDGLSSAVASIALFFLFSGTSYKAVHKNHS